MAYIDMAYVVMACIVLVTLLDGDPVLLGQLDILVMAYMATY